MEDATITKCNEITHFGRLHVMIIIHVSSPRGTLPLKMNSILPQVMKSQLS